MSMPASVKAEPPDAPVVVAYLPDASMDVSIFSTDCAVSDVQPSHAWLKTPLEMLDGFQLANTSTEKSVREVQFNHASRTSLTLGSLVLKLPILVLNQANLALLVNGMLSTSKLVNSVISYQAA